jgi:predicted DNA-binding transcriptional regulator AlpA
MPAKVQSPATPASNWFDELPDAALVREHQIIDKGGNRSPLVCVSSSTWWRWVRAGKAPQPFRLSDGVSVWQVGRLRAWLVAIDRSAR